MRGIAIRRHHRDRIKTKTRAIAVGYMWEGRDIDAYVQSHWQNRAKCSCPMCGNPRRHFGEVTRQESVNRNPKAVGSAS